MQSNTIPWIAMQLDSLSVVKTTFNSRQWIFFSSSKQALFQTDLDSQNIRKCFHKRLQMSMSFSSKKGQILPVICNFFMTRTVFFSSSGSKISFGQKTSFLFSSFLGLPRSVLPIKTYYLSQLSKESITMLFLQSSASTRSGRCLMDFSTFGISLIVYVSLYGM